MNEKQNSKDIVINYILGEIRCGNLNPGDKIMTERKLSDELGISRVPIREAISTLSTIGILGAKQGDGTFVKDYNISALSEIVHTYGMLDRSIIDEVFEARCYFEADACKIAAKNKTKEDIIALAKALNEHENALVKYYNNEINAKEMMEYDGKVHLAIALASHNEFIVQVINMTRNVTSRYQIFSEKYTINNNHFKESAVTHRKIVNEIIDGNSENAYKLMQEHIFEIREAVDIDAIKNITNEEEI